MKRHENEPFADYKERRSLLNKLACRYCQGRSIRPGRKPELDDKGNLKGYRSYLPYTKKQGDLNHNGLTGKLNSLYDLSLTELKRTIGVKDE